jgi:hypothetical protein
MNNLYIGQKIYRYFFDYFNPVFQEETITHLSWEKGMSLIEVKTNLGFTNYQYQSNYFTHNYFLTEKECINYHIDQIVSKILYYERQAGLLRSHYHNEINNLKTDKKRK